MLERTFDAPREKVWQTWTEPEMIKKWWGPKGFTAPEIKIDLRKGGNYLYCMRGQAGPDEPVRNFWSGGIFREIMPMEKIVLTDYFTNEKGAKVSPSYYGMNKGFPEEMTLIINFEKRGKSTKLTLDYPNLGSMPTADREAMRQGWNQSLDKFEMTLKTFYE